MSGGTKRKCSTSEIESQPALKLPRLSNHYQQQQQQRTLREELEDIYGIEFISRASFPGKSGNASTGLSALFTHHILTHLFLILNCTPFSTADTLPTAWHLHAVSVGERQESAGSVAEALGWNLHTLNNRRVYMNKAFALLGLPLPQASSSSALLFLYFVFYLIS